MTREEKVQFWLDVVAEDLDLAEFLLKSGRWLYSAFMCHQVIEKVLKAYWTATRDDTHIEARYPDYKRAVAKSLNAEITSHFVEQTKQMQQWILQKCFLAMKPSGSSENTNA